MMGINIITANFSNGGRQSITRKLYQYDYGQKVSIRGLSLPSTFEVHISNDNNINTAEVYTGTKNEIEIPDKFLLSGKAIYMWLFLHNAENDGQTRYVITIPVEERPKPQAAVPVTDENTINQLLIAALQNPQQAKNSTGINIVTANFKNERNTITRKLYQYDYGQIINIKGLNLPKAFEVHISNSNKASTAQIYIGNDDQIEIPNKFLLSGEDIYLWIFLHSTATDGQTRYTITVPVQKKPKPESEEPTEVERNTIDQLIAALEINLNEMRQATEDAKTAMDQATAAAKEQMQLAIDKANDVVSKYPKIIEDYWYIYDVENQVWVNTQIKALAVDGVGIKNIVYNNDYTITINLTDGTSYTTESIRGQKGDKGDTGATPNIKIQSTETLAPNQYANVTISGTPEEPRLTFRIPKGEKGDKGDTGAMPQISIGTVETLLPHRAGYVTQTGTAENPVLNFGLVKGETGEQGPQGQKGDTGEIGPQGIQGQTGPKGEKGQQGIQGETGPKGDKGDTGERGQTGKNAYEYAVDGGYTGNENDFSERLANIKTPQEIDQSITNAINNSGHYIKPTIGIPKSDLDIDVQTSLGKADTAVQDLTEIQTSIQELTTRLNTLIDSDDITLDQLSEIVAYIKNNKSLIDNITTGKISVTDIVDNLTSNVANKPLSAKQGKVLKDLIDAIVIPTKVSDLVDDSGHYTKPSGGIPASDLADGVVPVEDVQVNGTSIVADGVANVPIASENDVGVVKLSGAFKVTSDERLTLVRATNAVVKAGTNQNYPLVPYTQDRSTFYGLAKAAGDTTQSSSDNEVGNYTDSAKTAINKMIGSYSLNSGEAIPTNADLNTYTTPGTYNADSTVIASITNAPTTTNTYKLVVETVSETTIEQIVTAVNGKVYRRTGDSSSTSWTFSSWIKDINSTDVASTSTVGVVKIGDGFSNPGDGTINVDFANADQIKAGSTQRKSIAPYQQHRAVFYGLAKAAGEDMASSNNAVGTYTDNAKTAIRTMLGAVGDVQVNGTSVTSNGVANIPMADGTNPGVVKFDPSGGIRLNAAGQIDINRTTSANAIKQGAHGYLFVPTISQHISTFYGLAKAAGEDMASSSNAVGTYTDAAKSAIKTMLGVPTDTYDLNLGADIPTNADLNAYTTPGTYNADTTVISGITNAPTTTETYKLVVESIDDDLIKQTAISKSHVYQRTGDVSTSSWVFTDWVQNITSTDYATQTTGGIAKVGGDGLNIINGKLYVQRATDEEIKACVNGSKPIVPSTQNAATFYGLAKAAGDTTQSASDNVVGTYTTEAKTAIRTMLGTVGDVQVNGTSITSDGVANIPIATNSSVANPKFGVVMAKLGGGTMIDAVDHTIIINRAGSSQVKSGTALYMPIVPYNQHEATFYGLAKAAGADMASSSNAVGTYTQEAKTAIQTMLGVTVPEAVGSCVEYISDSSVTIVGEPNTRYVCGEVTSISITPPAVGTIDVVFTSGSTIAILTLPSTVKMPEWWGGVETGYTYELVITDGVYAGVMAWPQ